MRDQIPDANALPAGLPEEENPQLAALAGGGHIEVIIHNESLSPLTKAEC